METLNEFIAKHRSNKEKSSSFVEYLYSLMNKYGFENASDLYTEQTFPDTHNGLPVTRMVIMHFMIDLTFVVLLSLIVLLALEP